MDHSAMPSPQPIVGRRRSARVRIAGALVLLLIAGAFYAAFPRAADLRGFDSAAMADGETAMWRHYYEKDYAALFLDLYGVTRRQYGFSPLASLRIAVAAARAARAFQPSTSRAEADVALPYLLTYFGLLSPGAAPSLDVQAAARLELDWWQARREDQGAEIYGLTIARVASLVYGVDNDALRQSGVLRARAMAYRDQHAAAMTEADWTVIDRQLREAYARLKRALAAD